MRKTVIVGAGQSGRMLKKLLRPNYMVVAFADNDKSKWGIMGELPVVSYRDAIDLNPDSFWIAVMKRDIMPEICSKIRSMGYRGEIHTIHELRDHYDYRTAQLRLIAEEITARNIEGEIAELGVFRGEFAAVINGCFPDRPLHLFDTFEGFHEEDTYWDTQHGYSDARQQDYSQTTPEDVIASLPFPENAVIHRGVFPKTAPNDKLEYAFISIDVDLFAPTYSGLTYFYPRLAKGGSILIHDYNNLQYRGVKVGVNQYCKENSLYPTPLCDLHGSAILMKC